MRFYFIFKLLSFQIAKLQTLCNSWHELDIRYAYDVLKEIKKLKNLFDVLKNQWKQIERAI